MTIREVIRGVPGGVRAGHALLAGAGGLAALGMLTALVSQSALAVDLTAAHDDTRLYLDGMSGKDVGLAGVVANHAGSTTDATAVSRGRVGVRLDDVTINGLCLVATHEVPGVGQVSAVITAGEPVDGQKTGEKPVALDSLTLDVSSLKGQAYDASEMTLGQSADDVPGGIGAPGAFGVAAKGLHFDDLELASGSLDLSSGATLPGLQVRSVTGAADRSDCR